MEEELLIPYFSFHDLSKKGLLLLKVYINRNKFSDVKFAVKDNQLFISSGKYKKKQYCAKVQLPVNIRNFKDDDVRLYNQPFHRYELLLEKNPIIKPSELGNLKIPNLDVITKFLSWKNDVQEEPDNLQNSAEVVFKTLSQLKLDGPDNEFENESITRSIAKLQLSENCCTSQRVSPRQYTSTCEVATNSYGFARKYKNTLECFEGNWRIAIELPNPENTDIMTRSASRWEHERRSFDVEHYLADYFLEQVDEENETIPLIFQIMKYKPYWHRISRATEKILTPEQMAILAGLPCKNFELKEIERLEVLHSLLDIILAYAYDYRITCGKHNSESAWNINKLSSTLSWFQVHKNVGEAVGSFFRRSLTFPLYRFWLLSLKVLDDALEIFYLGRRQLLNCLVSIYEIFDADDDRRILNELYIEDYLIWIQKVHPQTIRNYVAFVQSCRRIKKQDVFSILPAMEQEAIKVLKSDSGYDSWYRHMSSLGSLVNPELLNMSESSSSDGSSTDSESSES